MKKIVEMALGVVTSVGGFLEIGSITTAAQAGALFGFRLTWAVALGGLCVMFLVEQSGRLAAVSRHTIPDAIRERFGLRYFLLLLVVIALVSLLVLSAEIGGVCVALEFVTGVGYRWWTPLVAVAVWLIIWKGTFSVIEQGVSALGLVTVCFVVGAWALHPRWAAVAAGLLPTRPDHDAARYWFIAVSILGASITPCLMFFYSSGAVEDEWDETYLNANRVIAAGGMGFGSVISAAVLVVAALVFLPRGVRVEHYAELAPLLTDAFGRWGVRLVAAALGVACLGAALEITLALAYMVAQGFGWNWSENQRPKAEARFSLTYTAVVALGALLIGVGPDPLKLTVSSMALTAATLPLAIVPFLFLMNDEHYVGRHVNGRLSNAVVLFVVALAFVLAVVTIPLQIFGGS
ncbi:MAG TPA: divalent metal cation transporter [Pyrinomonadaceae bacterium]|jgi:Mn2+/Fe2+ NRAMP family transporter